MGYIDLSKTQIEIKTEDQVQELLKRGEQNKTPASVKMNLTKSGDQFLGSVMEKRRYAILCGTLFPDFSDQTLCKGERRGKSSRRRMG